MHHKLRILLLLAVWTGLWTTPIVNAATWNTHFAYNSVQQIAVSPTEVYALANGSMFSVNKITEKLTKYDSRFGLHGSTIACLAYDEEREQLLIFYEDGKMDILRQKRVYYIADLYRKQMTSQKRCNNVTISGRTAYLAMEFGLLLFDLVDYEFTDAYYIGRNATEVNVQDILLHGDSIYAKAQDAYYCASLKDNIVDYRYWHKTSAVSVPFDVNKGIRYTDIYGTLWVAAQAQGIYRHSLTGEEVYYLPDGPSVNIPYRMLCSNGKLFVVSGGRWASQYSRPGHVMLFEDGQWTTITQSAIQAKTGKLALDMMNVAVDPTDDDHFFVTSYGTGMYEFQGTELVHHYTPANSIIGSAAPAAPDSYTRTDCAVYDDEGRLWLLVAGDVDTTVVAIMPDGTQHGINLINNGEQLPLYTPGGLIIDFYRNHCKWILSCRADPKVILLDDNDTPFDMSDDRLAVRSEFYDQDMTAVAPELFYTIAQAPNGDVWVGSATGPICFPRTGDFLTSNACQRLRITMSDGTYLLAQERVNAFAFDAQQQIWIGTQTAGVYVLDSAYTQIVAHYTNEETPMPSNAVISLAYDSKRNTMYIGTGGGLVSCSLGNDTTLGTRIDTSEENHTVGTMKQWKAHFAYNVIDEVAVMGNSVYALSNGSLFEVDKQRETITLLSKLTGLSSSNINHIAYNATQEKLLITYNNGQWDVIDRRGDIGNISDLFLKTIQGTKQVNDIAMSGRYAYLAMSFGVIVVDMVKEEVKDTYYIGDNASEVNVQYITLLGDSIYAVTDKTLYTACLNDNLVDYVYWHTRALPSGVETLGMEAFADRICILRDDTALYSLDTGKWTQHPLGFAANRLCMADGRLFALPQATEAQHYVREVGADFTIMPFVDYGLVHDLAIDGTTTWLGTNANGLVRIQNSSVQEFHPEGPANNFAYRLRCFGNRLYVLPGGRWASQFYREGVIMYYENGSWTNISNAELVGMANHVLLDFMNVAHDPADASHYFVTSYGTGLLEMRGEKVVQLYLPSNSSLTSAVPNTPDLFTRTDGAIYDEQGNLWVLNAGVTNGISIRNAAGQWTAFGVGEIATPGEILIDNRNTQWKWIPQCRSTAGITLLQDNGTPTVHADDKVTTRQVWYDQQGRQVMPTAIYTMAQDKNGDIWVGTSEGIFIIPTTVDFTSSNRCERIIIPRNDGSGLGDYLLDKEHINAIAIDGANRKWIGTETSGVYLMSEDGIETLAHFTMANSLMPDDNVTALAIMETTGEVFIGTSAGLVSYQSDAAEPESDFNSLYAYPNPVHPNYKGYITIKGLMDNTEVRITDAEGNLVKTLQGNGGLAVWDGTNTVGRRVASGVYTAICNTQDGAGHGTVKILIMN